MRNRLNHGGRSGEIGITRDITQDLLAD